MKASFTSWPITSTRWRWPADWWEHRHWTHPPEVEAAMPPARPLSVLTIAGSDSGGGAGIQADLKTFAAHGVHGLSAIAALTAQNTRARQRGARAAVAFLRAQIDACFDDFRIGAVKIGMLANARVIHAVADALEALATEVDRARPGDGRKLAARGCSSRPRCDALRRRLLPLATVITPNIPEAELLLGPSDRRRRRRRGRAGRTAGARRARRSCSRAATCPAGSWSTASTMAGSCTNSCTRA